MLGSAEAAAATGGGRAEAGRLRKASRVQHTKPSDRLRLGFSGYRA